MSRWKYFRTGLNQAFTLKKGDVFKVDYSSNAHWKVLKAFVGNQLIIECISLNSGVHKTKSFSRKHKIIVISRNYESLHICP